MAIVRSCVSEDGTHTAFGRCISHLFTAVNELCWRKVPGCTSVDTCGMDGFPREIILCELVERDLSITPPAPSIPITQVSRFTNQHRLISFQGRLAPVCWNYKLSVYFGATSFLSLCTGAEDKWLCSTNNLTRSRAVRNATIEYILVSFRTKIYYSLTYLLCSLHLRASCITDGACCHEVTAKMIWKELHEAC